MNEQLPPLPGHPEPHSMKWSELELAAIKEYGEQCARAALAMSPKQTSGTSEREAFEAWVKNTRGSPWPIALDKADAGNYMYLPATEAWAVWQARAALAAKVPADLPENETPQMHDAAMAVLYAGVTRGNTNALWKAYRAALLAATPAPAPEAEKVPADPCLVLWKAMNQAGKVGNRTDDKLIVKFLREAGYCIAPAPAPEAVKRYAICHETEQICSACPTRSVACEAAKPEAQQAAELAKAHEARRYAQSEVAYLKARLSGARLILMRELKEQGWTPPAPAQAQRAAEPLAWLKHFPGALKPTTVPGCTFLAEDALAMGWEPLGRLTATAAKPEAQHPDTQDAERYRWLTRDDEPMVWFWNNTGREVFASIRARGTVNVSGTFESVHAAIDAARGIGASGEAS